MTDNKANKVQATDSKKATVAATPKAAKGYRRVTHKAGAQKQIDAYVTRAALPIDAFTACNQGLKLAKTDPSFTIFGHSATGAMTSVVDQFFVDFAKTGAIDTQALARECFNAVVVTSKVKGRAHLIQVDCTFKKVLSHLQNLDTLNNKCKNTMWAKQHNQKTWPVYADFELFVGHFSPTARAIRNDFQLAYSAFKKLNGAELTKAYAAEKGEKAE